MNSDKQQTPVKGTTRDQRRRPSGKVTPKEARIAEQFLEGREDKNWPATPMQRRMQGAGR
ncbi:hypothetical protein [Enterovirga aerilata]|uniref:Uncharacterized protein n=1 Tax=Enterovirga aerilata TaxID=2730920 RepID=A0A849I1B5_9HYPH|nr:hypothetical protein [Enterovirga sp. DB1703]NNM73152.1 hypothetical protein [Enterovirga sp. DB1703]